MDVHRYLQRGFLEFIGEPEFVRLRMEWTPFVGGSLFRLVDTHTEFSTYSAGRISLNYEK